jgi:hypothetical protein
MSVVERDDMVDGGEDLMDFDFFSGVFHKK